ncbi:sulfatase-like hydrolase/transferase [Cryomorphaceae bacterium 1068]|nr:sulfatase-like hydrolase/transferase [Cryomorphaceae bacterium 1068]
MFYKLKLGLVALLVASSCFSQSDNKPNILLIICDDLNRMGMGTMEDPMVYTPNIDSLVSESFVFTNAHANVAGCGPSRASMFTGVLPQTSGHSGYKMSQNSWLDNPILAPTTSVFKQFLDHGYDVYGSGKVYHGYRLRSEDFTEFNSEPLQGPFASNKQIHSDLPESFQAFDLSFARLENVPSYPEYTGWQHRDGSPFHFENDENRDLLADEMTVEYCQEVLASLASDTSDKPFFLSAGIFNPHQPLHVPGKYWDLYDTTSFDFGYLQPDTTLPSLTALTNRYNANSNLAYDVMEDESPSDDPYFFLRQFIQGYYASVSFVDDQVGALIEALEINGFSENTIVILTSDHGFHLGSKGLLAKSTLWNDATSIPFIIKVPGESPQIISDPVSLIDLYPTLLEYGQVPEPESHAMDGLPLQSLISGERESTAILNGSSKEFLEVGELNEVFHSHHAYLKDSYKYVYYSSGEDELYDIEIDFRETNDLSGLPEFQKIRNSMYRGLRNKIGFIRPPEQSFECLYYGDFEQDLNGWGPSEPDSNFGLAENDSIIDSQHLLMFGNSSRHISNENVIFKTTGAHTFGLTGYSNADSATVFIRIATENHIFLDTVLTIFPDLTSYEFSFDVSEPLPAHGDLALYLKSNSDIDVHVDDVFLRNLDAFNESLTPCQFAEPIQTDVLFTQVENRAMNDLLDQSSVTCESISGSAPQLWQQFSPDQATGIIGVRIQDLNPVIELFSDCNAQSSICLNQQTSDGEASYLTDLNPGATYYLRITSEIDSPIDNLNAPQVKSIFLNATPAQLAGESYEVLNQTDFLELVDQPVFDQPIKDVQFHFEKIPTGESITYSVDFDPSLIYPMSLFPDLVANELYIIKVKYRVGVISTTVPYGPVKKIFFKSEFPIISQFLLFPNPTTTDLSSISLRFNNMETGMGIVNIFDMTGRQIFSKQASIQSSVLNLSGLPPLSQGTYVVAFKTMEGKSAQELLFVH